MFDQVVKVVAEHLDVEVDTIKEETTFAELGIDSLDAVELVMELEDEFDAELDPTEAGKSIKELVEYIESKVNA